jgi:hypothetical protein
MAFNTWDGSSNPDAHADPVEISKPGKRHRFQRKPRLVQRQHQGFPFHRIKSQIGGVPQPFVGWPLR